ncbi:MAG: cyclic nucleotide-binding domain-containing protein [Synechococcales cyanobacterium CRU_2_2]|nr:cyclic nucleotide-binding domain-containing protein [Synechococcales cyanobacterium CRU_2_2]
MTYTELSIPTVLTEVPPFSLLPRPKLEALSSRCQLLRYRMGQPMLRRDNLPHQILIVVEGEARLLGLRPLTQLPFTLKTVGVGGILGWVSLLRGIPCETANAREETLCITLPTRDFVQLVQSEPAIAQYFNEQVDPSEIADLIGESLKREAKSAADLPELLPDLQSQARVKTVDPGTLNATDLPKGYEWWVSGRGQVSGADAGDRLGPVSSPLEVVSNRPVRLLGLPLHHLTKLIQAKGIAPLPPWAIAHWTSNPPPKPRLIGAKPFPLARICPWRPTPTSRKPWVSPPRAAKNAIPTYEAGDCSIAPWPASPWSQSTSTCPSVAT